MKIDIDGDMVSLLQNHLMLYKLMKILYTLVIVMIIENTRERWLMVAEITLNVVPTEVHL